MAFVVQRADGRFEIRESVTTPAGPRAHTLASFRVLNDRVIGQARARARRPFDAPKIRARARALGVPERRDAASVSARALIGQLREGEQLPPALRAELGRRLSNGNTEYSDALEGALEWIGADDARRGRALRDLLRLASAIPSRRRPGPLVFPRLVSARS